MAQQLADVPLRKYIVFLEYLEKKYPSPICVYIYFHSSVFYSSGHVEPVRSSRILLTYVLGEQSSACKLRPK